MQNREDKLSDAANLIENNLVLLGATAIEDKLQNGVSILLKWSPIQLHYIPLQPFLGC